MALKISIVTPSYNQAEFLEATLQSVLGQDHPSVEYVVMDGGSDDGSQAILERYAPQLEYVQSRPDKGQTDALIEGFGRVTGHVMAWLNSDDVYEPGVLSEVARYFEEHPEDRFVFGDATWIDRDGIALRRKREMPFNRFVWLRTYNYIPQPSAFWRRDLYEEVGGLDPSFDLAMDTDLFARFAERARLRHVPSLWSRIRAHPDQRNRIYRERSDDEDQKIRGRYVTASGRRWEAERLVAKALRVAWRGASAAYWR